MKTLHNKIYHNTWACWDVLYPLAGLDPYTRAKLSAISWNPEKKCLNDLECQSQWPPYSIPVKRILRCVFGANLVNLAKIDYKLLLGQAKFPKILRNNLRLFSITTMAHVSCIFCDSSRNLWWVIMQTSQISENSKSKWPKWPRSSWSMT